MSVTIWPGKARVRGSDVTLTGFSPDLGPVKQDIEDIQGDVSQLSGEITDHTEDSSIHVTADDKSKWNGIDSLSEDVTSLYSDKQDVISDLDTIRSGAAAGATALQSVPIADQNTFGLTKPYKSKVSYGITMDSNGAYVNGATADDIAARTNKYKPITPNTLNAAVTAALTDDNAMALDDAAKKKCCATLGAAYNTSIPWVLIGNLSTEYRSTGITLDLTGYTELFIKGTYTATGNCTLSCNISGLIYAAMLSSKKFFVGLWVDTQFGYDNIYAKTTSGSGNVAADIASGYCNYDGHNISSINRIYLNTPDNVTTCNIEIYAR